MSDERGEWLDPYRDERAMERACIDRLVLARDLFEMGRVRCAACFAPQLMRLPLRVEEVATKGILREIWLSRYRRERAARERAARELEPR